jgi:MATE family multidrug resistance protein
MTRQFKLKRRVAHARHGIVRRAAGRLRWEAPFGGTMRALVALAGPIVAAMGGETIMGLVDTKLVSGLGPAALGGVGVAMTIVFFGYMTIFGLMRGVKVCVAHAVGEGQGHRGVRYAQAGVVLGVVSGAAVWAGTRDVAPWLRAVGIEAALVPYASAFLSTFTFGAPASAVVSALTQHRQALGDSRTPMVVGLAGNVLNARLGWSLIYGHGGLPALGVRGGAIATATCEGLEAIALLALLARRAQKGRSGEQPPVCTDLPLRRAIAEVTQLGVPTGLQFGSEMLAFVTFTALLGTLGIEQIAAHQIALAAIRTSFLPGTAVAEAASVLVGQALGRRSLPDADRTTRAALLLAVGFMASCGVLFVVGGSTIVRAFTDDPVVARVARRLLWIAAGFQVLDAVSIVLRGALRGARDVRVPAVIGVAVVWTCVPTAALVLGRLAGWGAAGGWCGFVAETTLGAALFGARWRHGPWRRAYASGGTGAIQSAFGAGSAIALGGES